MAGGYTKRKAWQLAPACRRQGGTGILVVYMKEFQKNEIGLISYMI